MIDRKDFILPWQKNWPKPPARAEVFQHFDHSINRLMFSLVIYSLALTIINLFFGSEESAPIQIMQPVIYLLAGGFILGVAAEIFRPRYWKLSLWEDGAIYQTLFQCITLTKQDLSNLTESSRLGLSLRINAGGKTKYASYVGMQKLSDLRKHLALHTKESSRSEPIVFRSPLNLSINYIGVPVSSGVFLMYLASERSAPGPLSWFKVCAFYMGLLLFIGILPSLSKNLGFKVTLTQDDLIMSHIFTKKVKWENVDNVVIQEKGDLAFGRLTIATPDKIITIPETVVNYLQLEKQILKRTPSSAKVTRQ